MTFFDYLILPFFLFWFLTLFFIFFRRDIELVWKLSFVIVFLFYLFQMGDELKLGYERISKNYLLEIYEWIIALPKFMYFFLFFCWPVVLLRVFFSASYILSIKVIKVLLSVTCLYWISFILYDKYGFQIDVWIKKMIF